MGGPPGYIGNTLAHHGARDVSYPVRSSILEVVRVRPSATLLACWGTLAAACGRLNFGPDVDSGADANRADGADSTPGDVYAAAVRRHNPLAYWRFDDTRTPTALDASGQGHHGTYAAVALGRPGAVGDGNTAVELLNTFGAQIDMGQGFGFEGNAAFTIEMWLNPGKPSGILVGKNDFNTKTSLYDGWLIYYYETQTMLRRAAENFPAPPIPVGEYSHVVATYDGVTVVVYINGSGTSYTTSTPMPSATSPFLVGRQAMGQWAPYVGLIDELAIYDIALTPSEVAEHYRIARP